MKRNKIFLFALAMAGIFSSCSDWLDVNESPNNPQYSEIPPTLSLSAAQTMTFRSITGDNQNFESSVRTDNFNQLGNLMMNSWAGNVNSVTNPYNDEYRSLITSSFYGKAWDWTYRNVANFQKITEYASADYDNHKGIAKILKSFYMQYMVDLYGDVPYSQAFKGQANLYPTYDDDKEVYKGLINEINEGIALIEGADANDVSVGTEDAMLNGNMDEWIRFANTVKLRILVRESEVTDADVVAFRNQELAALAGAEFITRDITINPGYRAASATTQNPFYGAYGYNVAGAATSNRNFVVASAHAANQLNLTNDPRRGRLFTLVSGNVVGIAQGEEAQSAPDNPSLLGPAIIPVPVSGNASVGSSMNGYVMTLSEAKFVMAEATLRFPGQFTGYDAETLFNEGIQSSFTRLGATGYAAYMASIAATPGFGWGATTDKIEAIMTQKWIALMNVHAVESWIDYTRTGFPVTPLPLTNAGVGRPKRLMYPASEYVGNSANVPAQTSATVFATGPFWLVP